MEFRLGANSVPLDLDWFSRVELKSKLQGEDVGSSHPDMILKVSPMCPVTWCPYPPQSTPLESGWSPILPVTGLQTTDCGDGHRRPVWDGCMIFKTALADWSKRSYLSFDEVALSL